MSCALLLQSLKKAGLTDLIVSVGRKKTSDSKRQFFTKVKAESVFRIVFILWVSPFPDLPQPQRLIAFLSWGRVGLGSCLVCICHVTVIHQAKDQKVGVQAGFKLSPYSRVTLNFGSVGLHLPSAKSTALFITSGLCSK